MSSPAPTAVVTGAGSGVGRAVVLKLAQHGWRVALIGRRADALAETIHLAGPAAERLAAFPCDLGDAHAVSAAGKAILSRFGQVDALVNAAGTNIPKRSLSVLSLEDYHATLGANLHGALFAVQAFLPSMRERRSGTIVTINSEAGVRASAKAGAAYVVSKFGLAGLTQTINAEERANGIRACSIFPGDINTPLLDKRPQPPSAEARTAMLQPEDVADCVWLAINLPPRAIVEELVVRPR
ncbi:MAG: SDR family NAD(P)-dependent oxidoreductase [Opitutaceae bacterium]